MPRPRLAAAFVALPLTLAVGLGQPPAQKKDPQAAYEPRSGPGAGQKFLEKFVGEWAVEKKFFPRGGGEPAASKGTCKQEMVHDGRFLRSEFTFDGSAGKTTGTGLIGFEPDTGLFTSVWLDSRQTRMSFRKSKDKFDGQKIILFGQNLGGEPETRRSRTVTTLEDQGAKIVHRQYSIAADGTERLVMQLEMTRRPAGK